MRRDVVERWWLALGLLVALSYTTTDLALSAPNERSRLYLTVAMFESRAYAIDQVRLQLGSVLDEAYFNGHFFSDKAPGSSLLALVPYAALRLFVSARDVTLPMLLMLGRYAVMVPIGIATFLAFEALGRRLHLGRAATRWASLAYLLATPAFHYSAAFFGHQIVALCFVVALWLIVAEGATKPQAVDTLGPAQVAPRDRALEPAQDSVPLPLSTSPRRANQKPPIRLVLAGLVLGVAGATEYQAAIGIALLFIYAIVASPGRRLATGAALVLGGMPFVLWLLQYQKACFGGSFELSYHHLANPMLAEVHRHGIGGVALPTWLGLKGSLVSLHRGLFATAPFLLLAPLGLWGLWRRGHVALAGAIGSLTLLYLGFIAGSATWDAGWGYGSRLLIPATPMLCLCVAAALDQARRSVFVWGIANSALLTSFISFQVVTALFAEPPNDFYNPWLDVVLPLGRQALVAPNWGSLFLGLGGWLSLVPLSIVLAWLVWPVVAATHRSVRSNRWVAWLPLVPLIWTLAIAAQKPTVSANDRANFVAFVRSLRTVSPAGQ